WDDAGQYWVEVVEELFGVVGGDNHRIGRFDEIHDCPGERLFQRNDVDICGSRFRVVVDRVQSNSPECAGGFQCFGGQLRLNVQGNVAVGGFCGVENNPRRFGDGNPVDHFLQRYQWDADVINFGQYIPHLRHIHGCQGDDVGGAQRGYRRGVELVELVQRVVLFGQELELAVGRLMERQIKQRPVHIALDPAAAGPNAQRSQAHGQVV